MRVGTVAEEKSPTSTCGPATVLGGAGDQQAGDAVDQDTIARFGERFRWKNQGVLALETLGERAEEDQTGVERNAREARDGRNPDTEIGSEISRGWMKSKEIRELSERLQRKRSRTAPMHSLACVCGMMPPTTAPINNNIWRCMCLVLVEVQVVIHGIP